MVYITALILLLVFINDTTANSSTAYSECRLMCKNHLVSNFHSNVCQGAIKIMPKPSVYNACMKGKLLGFEHVCISSCAKEIDNHNFIGSSYEACKSMIKKPIPNHHFPWCRRGYDTTFNEAQEIFDETLENLHKVNKDNEYSAMEYRDDIEEEIKEISKPTENDGVGTSQQNEEMLENEDNGKISASNSIVASLIEEKPQEIHETAKKEEEGNENNLPSEKATSNLDELEDDLVRKKSEELMSAAEDSVNREEGRNVYKTKTNLEEGIELETLNHKKNKEPTKDLSLDVNIEEIGKKREPDLSQREQEL